jgi:hypothetical protein
MSPNTIHDVYLPYMLRHQIPIFKNLEDGTLVPKHVGVVPWILFYDLCIIVFY